MAGNRGFHHGQNNYQQSDNSPKPPAALTDLLIKCCGMSRSDNDHQALVAIRTANRLLQKANLQWADVIIIPQPESEPEPIRRGYGSGVGFFWCWPAGWAKAVNFACRVREELSPRDRAFIEQLACYTETPSERQCKWLRDIAERLISRGFIP